MAKVTNTFAVSGAEGNREELSNVVNRITPEDTPLYSMMKKGTCNSIFPEWEIDTLSDPAENAQLEGDQFSYNTVDPVSRVGNATQIFRKSFIISKTQDSISNAGSAEQTKYQTLKKGVELRKDIEFALVSNTATVKTESGSITRKFGALPTWLETNTLRATGGADGGFKSNDGMTDVYTAGSARSNLDKDKIDSVLEKCYAAGANVKHMVMSPYAKRVFSGLMSGTGTAAVQANISSGHATIFGSADMYQSDFGLIAAVPNRVMKGDPTAASDTAVDAQRERAANVFFIDENMLEWKWLRSIHKVKEVSVTSDATPTVLLGEGTLCVKNEAGLGVIGDINGTSATL